MKTKVNVLIVKMVQREFSINDAIQVLDFVEAGEQGERPRMYSIPATVVKVKRTAAGEEHVEWMRGDVQLFDGDNVKVGQPFVGEGSNMNSGTVVREPDFEANEYCRLLHVLADDRMTTARAQLMEPRTREELDADNIDP
ncbi:hypothetical protein BWQ96_08411 [Gracilariopsis chorda]|uniref:Uncharacterized protein n=1 Tax=Gracilariopsis chorda TaxID=448386 RepID=A0A2V3IIG2_9FLOR|nr:hypothetical protein BWQ96_08411 [Gracilariopsis chorda]|eukprot:PXF41876.1 hypothetical protein BWQ96_08411 [Gracilariopsis chorda]